MKEDDLKSVLSLCEKSAEKGVKITLKYQEALNNTLKRAKSGIEDTINEFSEAEYNISDSRDSLEEQLVKIKNSFERLSTKLDYDIKKTKRNLSDFSITLFGRTMAGKSTLMEILTHGDGKTIGKGAQRTTRDIRTYSWNGLKITDVPGIAAFEGKEDEDLAFETAKSADLILFLITDDGPQVAEAECFSKIVKLGKPIICILNVKAHISDKDEIDFSLGLRNINKKMRNRENLDTIKKQFLDYSKNYAQDWTHIPFVYLHLGGAYLSQNIKNLENSKILYEASKISILKEKIIEQVKDKGEFYRIKTFVDLISVPIIDITDTLLEQSSENSSNGRVILRKKKELEKWKEKFYKDGITEIESFVIKIKSNLNSEIVSFVEDYFEDKNAKKEWDKIMKQKKIEEKSQDLLKKLENRCDEKVKEIVREVLKELEYSSYLMSKYNFKISGITDWKKIASYSLMIGGGVLSLAFPTFAIPIIILEAGIQWIISYFFDDINKKEKEARLALQNKLKKNVEENCLKLEKKLKKNFDKLMKNRIMSLVKELTKMNNIVFQLADILTELAWNLNENLLELNKQIVTEAIHLIGAAGIEYHINSVGRIPGNNIVFMLDDGKRIPEEEAKKLYKLISERIDYTFQHNDKKILISRVIGNLVERKNINIEDKIGVAHIQINKMSKEKLSKLFNKIKLAQQLSKILIINDGGGKC